jgi:peptide subunit release factor 1 (eRF1)
MICFICKKRLENHQETASGPAGIIHARCGKLGKVMDVFAQRDDIDWLAHRVQRLESQLEQITMMGFTRGGTDAK